MLEGPVAEVLALRDSLWLEVIQGKPVIAEGFSWPDRTAQGLASANIPRFETDIGSIPYFSQQTVQGGRCADLEALGLVYPSPPDPPPAP